MINIRNIVLGIAIFVLTLFVGIYGISTLYEKAPEYNDYCPYEILNESQCTAEGGVWVNTTDTQIIERNGPVKAVPGGYCSGIYERCQEEFNNAQEKYHRKVFFIAVPLGVIIIAFGAIIFGLEVVGAGLMAGGVGIIVYGAGGYWQYAKDWIKFVLSFVGLIIIVWLAYYVNRKWHR